MEHLSDSDAKGASVGTVGGGAAEGLVTRVPGRRGARKRSGPRKSAEGKFTGRRKVKPRLLALVTDACTGCAGAPVCQIYCPVDECMQLKPALDAFPSQLIWVDPLKCVGCRKCVTRGHEDLFLDGCPWDAIRMVATVDWEAERGELPY